MSQPTHEADTRHRVLECATRLFAEKGFRETTISDICEAAGANIAAVNYYFGSKEKLYEAAWRHAYSLTREAREGLLTQPSDLPPEQLIRRFVRTRLDDISRGGPESYFWQILEKEHHNPTAAHGAIIREVFRPLAQRVMALIGRILGPRASQRLLKMSLFALAGSVGFLTLHRHIVREVFNHETLTEADGDAVYDHVVRFLFAGLAASRQALERGEIHPSLMTPAERPTAEGTPPDV